MTRALVVKVTAGAEAPERCAQGFTVAAVAVSSGVAVSLWLTGEAVRLAVAGGELELPHSPPVSALRDAVLLGGQVTVCSQCAARRDLTDFLPGVRVAGAAVFVDEVLQPEVQALVY